VYETTQLAKWAQLSYCAKDTRLLQHQAGKSCRKYVE
jgi:hypothetical protein